MVDWTNILECYVAMSTKAKHIPSLGHREPTGKMKVHVHKRNSTDTIN